MFGLRGRFIGGRYPEPGQVVGGELEAAMHEAVLLLEGETKKRTPIGATESARGSIAGEVRPGLPVGRGARVVIGVVGSPLAHIEALERGRRPGRRPPSDALELWVRRRLRITNVKQARQVAFLIARAIGKRGTVGAHMFEDALKANRGKVERIFDRAGVRISSELVREGR